MSERELPSKERIGELIKDALRAKDYDRVAKIAIYYSLSKVDPKKFAQGFVKIAKLYEETGRDIKPDDSRIQKIIDEVLGK